MLNLGVIGYGSRMKGIVSLLEARGCKTAAITDIRNDKIKTEIAANGKNSNEIHFYSDPEEMLSNEKLDGVCVGTRCSLHAKMGAFVIGKKIPLFLEKPVAVTPSDLDMLKNAVNVNPEMAEKVVVSFPLRLTKHAECVKEIVDSGRLGKIEHVQAINNPPGYSRGYYHHWYRDEKETGGLWLQKATHDFDYINYILGIKPVKIFTVSSKQIFKGNKPAGMLCENCHERESCPESPENISSYGEKSNGPYCCYAVDTGNQDSGSAIILYETGMHAVYSQNFYSRKGAAKRGAIFAGYYGTVEFDWYTNAVKVFMHTEDRRETYMMDTSGGHGGGDDALVKNFVNVMRGKEKSKSDIHAGLLSARMCQQAQRSTETGMFLDI